MALTFTLFSSHLLLWNEQAEERRIDEKEARVLYWSLWRYILVSFNADKLFQRPKAMEGFDESNVVSPSVSTTSSSSGTEGKNGNEQESSGMFVNKYLSWLLEQETSSSRSVSFALFVQEVGFVDLTDAKVACEALLTSSRFEEIADGRWWRGTRCLCGTSYNRFGWVIYSRWRACLLRLFFFSVPVLGESLRVLFSLCFQSPAIKLDRSTGQPTWRTVGQQRITSIVYGGMMDRNKLMRNPDRRRVAFANPVQCATKFIQDIKAYMAFNCAVHCRLSLCFVFTRPSFLLAFYRR